MDVNTLAKAFTGGKTKQAYLKAVVDKGYQYQDSLECFFKSKGFEAKSLRANDSGFPDVKVQKDGVNYYIEAKSSLGAQMTSMRALSYFPPCDKWRDGHFEINSTSIAKYGEEGRLLIEFINSSEDMLRQGHRIYRRISEYFGCDFDVIGNNTFSAIPDKETRFALFGRQAIKYKSYYSTTTNQMHSVGKFGSSGDSFSLPVGKMVNKIFEQKVNASRDGQCYPVLITGPGNSANPCENVKWFAFALPSDTAFAEMFQATGKVPQIIEDTSTGTIELIMKIRFDKDRQLFDVGVVLRLD